MRIVFMLSRGSNAGSMKPQVVADTLAAYLLGAHVFRPHANNDDVRPHGPYRKAGNEFSWQLEHGNNYFLQYMHSTAEAVLYARYDTEHEHKLLRAIAELFSIRYDIPYRIEQQQRAVPSR
jgi:hypothetical protein